MGGRLCGGHAQGGCLHSGRLHGGRLHGGHTLVSSWRFGFRHKGRIIYVPVWGGVVALLGWRRHPLFFQPAKWPVALPPARTALRRPGCGRDKVGRAVLCPPLPDIRRVLGVFARDNPQSVVRPRQGASLSRPAARFTSAKQSVIRPLSFCPPFRVFCVFRG